MEFAMAISQTPSSSSMAGACQDPHDFKLLVLSKNIDVDFVTSSDMTMNPKVYAEVMNRMGGIGDSVISTVSKVRFPFVCVRTFVCLFVCLPVCFF